jgi:hypothetical protein
MYCTATEVMGMPRREGEAGYNFDISPNLSQPTEEEYNCLFFAVRTYLCTCIFLFLEDLTTFMG